MRTSESIVNLAKALLCFQTGVANIKKDASNPFFKNKYASLTNILDGINQHLNDAGIVVMQSPSGDDNSVRLTTTVIHAPSGEFIESEYSMIPVKKDPQGIGSCLTYMRRYALASILKLNVDDDDDGNSASNVGTKETKTNYNKPFVPQKKEATDADIQDLGLRFKGLNSLEALRSVYMSVVKDVRAKYSNPEETIIKLEIIKDEIKERFE
jgi:hypothetical protein